MPILGFPLGAPLGSVVGSIDYTYTTEANPNAPTAVVAPTRQDAIIGSVVRLDGRSSISPTGADLTYTWIFKQTPIGSQVLVDGFKALESDGSVVSFAPDIIGLYVVELVVNDGSFSSLPAVSEISTKVVLVPQNLGIVPDMSWVWNFLSDFWVRVEQRQRFETFWSAAIQIIAAEQLKLWQYDYNKSIQDIQELVQKRWVKYEPVLPLDAAKTTFVLSEDQAGLSASSFLIDTDSNAPQTPQPDLANLVTVPIEEGNFTRTSYGSAVALGHVLQFAGLSLTLERAGATTRAVNRGNDGSVVALSGTFHGSTFSAAMVGMYLRILVGPAAGTYIITVVPDSHTLTVTNKDGSPASFPTSPAGLSYSIFPQSVNSSAFFADQSSIPTRLAPVSWRMSSILISTQYDLEAQGVSPGDVITFQITRSDSQRTSTIGAQITAVDRNRAGFVFNTADLVDGAPSRGLSTEDQVKLATDLQIPGLMTSLVDGSLVYTDQAQTIKTTVQSVSFKRRTFEISLTSSTLINIGPFSIIVTPLRITRNSRVLIDSTIKSIPSLQEYVKQPDVVESSGELFQISESKLFPLARKPYTVYENADYVIDSETGISGTCAVLAGNSHVIVPFGDLLDRGIRQADTIAIKDGNESKSFRIIAIVDPETVLVSPAPDFTDSAAKFAVTRKVSGTFIRFIKGVFTKTVPAPTRLWAEVTFFDNNNSVESNFGVLVGVLRSDLSSVGATISYKNAVAGLMYALTNGPTVANLQLASQILLGLPFTTNAGTVVEIDPTFKTNLDGSPLLGRILIAAEDVRGKPLGVTNIYFYPQGRQIPDPANPGKWIPVNPDLSGLAVNETTGKEYAVGDHVARFVSLSKGTQVQDYLTTSALVAHALNQGNTAFAIQRYHAFQLIINADITTAVDTDLVAQFIRRAKPTYVKLALALSKALDDRIDIEDSLLFKRSVNVHDNVSMSLPSAMTFDPQNIDSSYLTLEGEMRERLLSGDDLVTTQGSYAVTSASGGFTTPRVRESHDGSFILKGYVLVILEGDNEGTYFIDSVDSDQQITLRATDYDETLPFNFETKPGQSFVVYRPLPHATTTAPAGDTACGTIVSGSGSVTTGSSTVVPSFGLMSPGVAVGDTLVFILDDAAGPTYFFSSKYKIISLSISGPSITLDRPVTETTGTYVVSIYREPMLTQSFDHVPDTPFITLNTTAGQQTGVFHGGGDIGAVCLINPGDTVILADSEEEFTVVDWDPTIAKVWFTPPALSTAGHSAFIERRTMPVASGSRLSLDLLDSIPSDFLSLKVYRRSVASGGAGPDLTTTATSATVTTVSGLNFDTGLGVVPGDYLVVLEGADSTRDIGYGAGIFPILTVSGVNLVLTRPLTATNAAPGVLYGIQRRRANER